MFLYLKIAAVLIPLAYGGFMHWRSSERADENDRLRNQVALANHQTNAAADAADMAVAALWTERDRHRRTLADIAALRRQQQGVRMQLEEIRRETRNDQDGRLAPVLGATLGKLRARAGAGGQGGDKGAGSQP